MLRKNLMVNVMVKKDEEAVSAKNIIYGKIIWPQTERKKIEYKFHYLNGTRFYLSVIFLFFVPSQASSCIKSGRSIRLYIQKSKS